MWSNKTYKTHDEAHETHNGFLELTAATVFGLVALAASVVGVIFGSVAVSRKTPPPP